MCADDDEEKSIYVNIHFTKENRGKKHTKRQKQKLNPFVNKMKKVAKWNYENKRLVY